MDIDLCGAGINNRVCPYRDLARIRYGVGYVEPTSTSGFAIATSLPPPLAKITTYPITEKPAESKVMMMKSRAEGRSAARWLELQVPSLLAHTEYLAPGCGLKASVRTSVHSL